MITEQEIQATRLSTTKKDFYQIYAELLETARKITERWDPTSTNESDPGITLLKVLTACTDKLNYNLDKNILEAFMPSAAQEESMRKLCNMLAYDIKYYRSATTEVTISYTGGKSEGEAGKLLDANGEEITTEGALLIPIFTSIKNRDDDVNYLTVQPAEITATEPSVKFPCIEGQLVQCETDTDNIISLNLLDDNQRYYLPETSIAENGIFIFNIDSKADDDYVLDYKEPWVKVDNLNTQPFNKKCYKFGFDSIAGLPYVQFPQDISALIEDGLLIFYVRTSGVNGNISAFTLSKIEKFWDDTVVNVSEDAFVVTNNSAATNGSNVESLNDAYNSYKKTIGTFDTLVTCRDYMNKIYQATVSTVDTTPLVSNCIVSDIRDDINHAVNICTFSDFGISYKDFTDLTRPKVINHFNLILYPFKVYKEGATVNNNKQAFLDSFKFTAENFPEILSSLDDCKTVAHDIILPDYDDVVCVKVYLKLNARIITTTKVTTVEEAAIKANIFNALYNTFNLRKVDFGEKIPTEAIFNCISNADKRIKNVFLDDPETDMYVRFAFADDRPEIGISSDAGASDYYIQTVAKNVLAGRVPLFNYVSDFRMEYTDTAYDSEDIKPIYPDNDSDVITTLQPKLELDTSSYPVELTDNEIVQFRAPNFKTDITYPGYVNYFIKLISDESNTPATACEALSLYQYFSANDGVFESFATDKELREQKYPTQEAFSADIYKYFKLKAQNGQWIGADDIDQWDPDMTYGIWELNENTFPVWWSYFNTAGKPMHKQLAADMSRPVGELVDAQHYKYQAVNTWMSTPKPLDKYFVIQEKGENAQLGGIKSNTEYQLKPGEYLLINYTKASDSDDPNSTDEIVQKYYGEGTIIRPRLDDGTLIDSETVASQNSRSYSKKTGILDVWDGGVPPTKPVGMYTLGAREQIEIRKLSKVEFIGQDTLFVYWTMGTLDPETGEKTFKEIADGESITLGENEYFCYTDINKNSMAYYGSGTEIRNNTGMTLKLKAGTKDLDIESIVNYGLNAIDWTKVYLKDDTSKITVQEFQYVNLAAGDKITAADTIPATLSNDWEEVSGVTYELNGETGKLPEIVVPDIMWEARTRLSVNVGPNKAQTLLNDSVRTESITLLNGNTEIATLQASDANNPLTLKANMLVQSSMDNIDMAVYTFDSLSGTTSVSYKFKIETLTKKNCSIQEVAESGSQEDVNLYNFGDDLTKISAKELGDKHARFYVKLADNTFGIAMIYVVMGNSDPTKNMYITCENLEPIIFNNNTWWSDGQSGGNYYLHNGINCIKFTATSSGDAYFDLYGETLSEEQSDRIQIAILSNCYQVNADNDGVNTKLLGIESTDASKVLRAIKNLDPDNLFYYNCPVKSSAMIDINYIKDSERSETLASPKAWLDYNNVYNKFVVEEIDADTLNTGIIISSSSKK